MPHVITCDVRGPAAPSRQRLTIDQRVALARRHRQGESVAALAEAYGITPRSVQRTLRKQAGATQAKGEPALPITFRAPAPEIHAFDAVAREAGLGRRGSAFRAVLRMAAGLVEVPGDELGRLHEATVRVSRLGINLNQLTRAVHRGKLRLGDEDRALLRGLTAEVEALRREWAAVHEAAQRRRSYAQRAMAAEGNGGSAEPSPLTPPGSAGG